VLQLHYDVEPRTQPVVSPYLVVRSALLELGYIELSARIEQELTENPALDVDLDYNDYQPLPPGVFSPATSSSSSPPPSSSGDGFPMSSLPAPQSLQDELLWQLHATAPESLHAIGEVLISVIDDDGYLHLDLFELAEDLDVPLEQVHQALNYVQQLSPPGVGARSLHECLQLQLQAKRENGELVPGEVVQVLDHFAACYDDDIAHQLAETTGLTSEQVGEALAYIRDNLHPYPGQQFRSYLPQHHRDQHIYPDAIIYGDGQNLRVEIPQSQAGALRVNRAYLHLERLMKHAQSRGGDTAIADEGTTRSLEPDELDAEQAQEVQDQIRRARRFIQMLKQRRATMQLIGETILEEQKGLILRGVMALRPLTKKQVAEKTGLHESTVSRATRHKYVMLPTGTLLPFDVFFEDALPVKALIAQIIQTEDADHPLTDRKLEEILGRFGHKLARRTVTKYRKQLGIPSSRHRRSSLRVTSPATTRSSVISQLYC